MGRNYSATAVDTTLSSAVTSTALSATVVAAVGFPTAPFLLAFIDSPGSQEIVQVTNVVGTALTITRGFDSTAAVAHPAGTVVRHVASAQDFREAGLHIDATTGVHGVGSGSVAGTTTAQTLTNKNLTSGTNVFPTFITGYLVPTGAGMEWHSTAAPPAGFLMQDNGEYLIASYTALYDHLTTNGTVFPHGANTNGAGAAGSTHFRTPLRKGKVAVGYNAAETEFNAIGKTGGAKTHTLSIAEIPAHNHTGFTGSDPANHTHVYQRLNPVFVGLSPGGSTVTVLGEPSQFADTSAVGGAAHTHSIPSQGGGGAHNNLQPYVVMNYIIKT